jgi:hypothetical protein
VKHLSGAPISGRPGWKSLPGTNTISRLIRKSINYGHKKFYKIGPGGLNALNKLVIYYTKL